MTRWNDSEPKQLVAIQGDDWTKIADEMVKRAVGPEAEARAAADQAREIDQEKRRRIDYLVSRGLEREYARLVSEPECLFDTVCLLHARQFHAGELRTLILAGGVGCGKTVAASWCVAAPARRGTAPVLVHVFDLPTLYTRDPALVRGTQLLAIDDLGVEVESAGHEGRFQSLLDMLLTKREMSGGRLVITTNLEADQLRERYGLRVWDRLRKSSVFVRSTDGSLR